MAKSLYINIDEINELQTCIMVFIGVWVRTKKIPVPQREIINGMRQENGTKEFTTVNALNSLLRKGYIRRAYTISNKTTYIQLRTV